MRRHVRTILTGLALAATTLAAVSTHDVAAQAGRPPADGACEILVQFYNKGTPGTPGVSGDGRFGVRLNVEGVYAVLPADRNGYVRFYGAVDHPVSFSAVPMYMSYAYTQQSFYEAGTGPGNLTATCGFNPVEVFAGT